MGAPLPLLWAGCREDELDDEGGLAATVKSPAGGLPPPGIRWLGPGERAALARLHLLPRRTTFLLGRVAAKRALIAAVAPGAAPSELEILAAPDGAPEAFAEGLPLGASVSISHSGEPGSRLGICALVPARLALGCDLEAITPRSQAFVDDFFTDGERRAMAAATAEARALLANLIWSAKESALKALRQGLRADTRSVEVQVDLPLVEQVARRAGAAAAGGAPWWPLAARLLDRAGPVLGGYFRAEAGRVWTVLAPVPLPPPRRADE